MKYFIKQFLGENKKIHRRLTNVLCILVLCLTLAACEKTENGYGSIRVKVVHKEYKLAGAKIFYKRGTLSDPNIPLEHYDGMLTSNSSGEITFDNMPPGNYFFHAKAISPVSNSIVTGFSTVVVRQRFRDYNTYDLIITVE